MELTGEQITAALFTKLKNIAEDTLGTRVFYDQYIGQNAFLSWYPWTNPSLTEKS